MGRESVEEKKKPQRTEDDEGWWRLTDNKRWTFPCVYFSVRNNPSPWDEQTQERGQVLRSSSFHWCHPLDGKTARMKWFQKGAVLKWWWCVRTNSCITYNKIRAGERSVRGLALKIPREDQRNGQTSRKREGINSGWPSEYFQTK